jgi:hypothetical protein
MAYVCQSSHMSDICVSPPGLLPTFYIHVNVMNYLTYTPSTCVATVCPGTWMMKLN